MTALKMLTEALFDPDTSDTEFYAFVAEEMSKGFLDAGLWTRSLADNFYDEKRARARYINLRVVSLKEEVTSAQKAQAAKLAYRSQLDAAHHNGNYAVCFAGWSVLASNGDASAVYSLAYLYAKGQGVEQNARVGYFWAAVAGLNGIPHAQALKNELIAQMISWDIRSTEVEAAEYFSSSKQIAVRS